METTPATKLKNLKSLSKTKLKKTIKNVVCRPDSINWLQVSEDEKHTIEMVLLKHSVVIPQFKKPHWKDVKSLPKEKRPKQPQCKKVDGLLFGLSECHDSIKKEVCSGILIESEVNPRLLVEPLIEDCCSHSIPYLCIKDLKKNCAKNFGIPTSCLGIKKDYLLDIQKVLEDIYKVKQKPQKKVIISIDDVVNEETPMNVDVNNEIISTYPYLYRNNKNVRVFKPSDSITTKKSAKFSGQNFIQLSDNNKNVDRKTYMNMILKRISSNPNRVKVKKSCLIKDNNSK